MSNGKELTAIPEHITALLNMHDLTPLNQLSRLPTERQINEAAKGTQIAMAGRLYAGLALLSAKESSVHGEFMALAQSYGFNSMKVSRLCRLAKLALRFPAEKVTALTTLTPSHWLEIESWSEEELTMFVNGERVYGITLEEADAMPIRAFKEAIADSIETRFSDRNRKLEATVDTQNNLIEQLEKEKEHLSEQLGKAKKEKAIPAYIPEVQEESSVLAEAFSAQLDTLSTLARQLQERQADCMQDPHLQDGWQSAAVTLHLNAQRLAAKAVQTLKQLESCLPEEILTHSGAGVHLSVEQAQSILSRSESILTELTNQRDIRQRERLAAQPRGRGRPRKEQE